MNLQDVNNLVRIKTFAEIYGKKFKENKRPVSKQRIGQMIADGKIPAKYVIKIDDTIFIDKTILADLEEEFSPHF